MALLEVENLESGYGQLQVLRGISLKVERGQVVTLIGANGAGKSTTLNTISGLITPTAGKILFDGRDITGARPDKIVEMGLAQVPEGRLVIANMSVEENLLMGAFPRKDNVIQQDLQSVYRRFPRLAERRRQKAGLLSGGEQQMLAVGRALMLRPRLLMLDEPSMGLAPMLVYQIFQIIAEIKEQGIPILLVEQNARKALQVADYAYVLERGQIVAHGPAHEMQRDAKIVEAYLG
ncbi:MAG: ABC transporter ATP-binding protein [Chloroflexi bacterium]|nr:MAG: ABC transporter ATP-binding protein [Chloroflexota bacterium]